MKGAWWVAATQPVILSIGAAFAALNLDLEPILDTLKIFKNEEDEIDWGLEHDDTDLKNHEANKEADTNNDADERMKYLKEYLEKSGITKE